MFSINTNIASLEAQNYLAKTSNLQNATIQQVSSGLRITDAGVDAAGLAIANGYANDEAVLTQGIANANDGQSQLQTIDGGLNNISQLLQRASTLATQSASGTFASGDAGRVTLNNEFQSVLQEVNRQAQSIGLNAGGQFAKDLSVFVGGGRASGTTTSINNGSVAVDLSKSAVDTQSLGLQGVVVSGSAIDLSAGKSTSVANILSVTNNQNSEATPGYANFQISGPGFSDSNKISVSVNLTGVTDTTTLANAVNTAIQQAGSAGTQYATAFKNANINATIVTDASTGAQHLAFNSSSTAFQVQAGDKMSNALMGVTTTVGGTEGASVASTLTAAASTAAATTTFGAAGAGTISFRIAGGGLASPENLSIAVTAGETVSSAVTALNDAVNGDTNLKGLGITLSSNTAGSPLAFTSRSGGALSVQTTGDVQNLLGMGSFVAGTAANAVNDYTSIGNAAGNTAYNNTTAKGTATFQFSLNGGASSTISAALNGGNATQGTFAAGTIASIPNATVTPGTSGNYTGVAITPPTAAAPTTVGDSVDVTIDGTAFSNIDVGGLTSEAAIAGAINTAITTSGTASFVNDQLVITSASTGTTSTVSMVASGGANAATAAEIGVGGVASAGTNAVSHGVQAGDTLSITIDGSAYNNIAVGGDTSEAGILTSINSVINGVGAGTGVASFVNDKLVVTSNSTGVGSSVAVTGNANGISDFNLTGGTGATAGVSRTTDNLVQYLNDQIKTNSDLQAAGIKAFSSGAGNTGKISFSSSNGTNFRLNAVGSQATVSSTTVGATGYAINGTNDQLTFAVDGGAAQTITLAHSAGESAAALATDITTKIAALAIPGLSASIAVSGASGALSFTEQNNHGAQSSISFSTSATNDALAALGLSAATTTGAGPDIGFGAAVGESFSANAATSASSTFDVAGANQLSTTVAGVNSAHALDFSGIKFGSDTQSLTINAIDSNGNAQPLNVTLGNNATLRNASSLDQAVATINSALQASNNATLQGIVAVKDDVNGSEKINFLSAGTTFSVTAAQTANGTGVGSVAEQGATQGSGQVGAGGTADISNQASAEAAVTALTNAVAALGSSQAVVGKGENEFTYASNLAQSQLTNETAAESQIRDANLAQQSAVLTKAQILLQAGVAALSQANSAPQQLLSLLQGH